MTSDEFTETKRTQAEAGRILPAAGTGIIHTGVSVSKQMKGNGGHGSIK